MDFNLTEEQLMIQQAARDFAIAELLPGVIERDEHSKFPTEQVKMMGELGFLGMMVDPKYGGSGLDTISYVLAMEEISKVDASASVVMWPAVSYGVHSSNCMTMSLLSTVWICIEISGVKNSLSPLTGDENATPSSVILRPLPSVPPSDQT